jgi:hypothetical protein
MYNTIDTIAFIATENKYHILGQALAPLAIFTEIKYLLFDQAIVSYV